MRGRQHDRTGELPGLLHQLGLGAGQRRHMTCTAAGGRPTGRTKMTGQTLRTALWALGLAVTAGHAQAADKISFGTNWLAQVEHGGFYQAVAEGIYAADGL